MNLRLTSVYLREKKLANWWKRLVFAENIEVVTICDRFFLLNQQKQQKVVCGIEKFLKIVVNPQQYPQVADLL